MDFAQCPEDLFRAHQLQQVTTNHGVEGPVAKRHVAGVDRLAMRSGVWHMPTGEALRARRHVGRKVESAGQAPRVDPHDSAEHLAGSGGDFEHAHAVADARQR